MDKEFLETNDEIVRLLILMAKRDVVKSTLISELDDVGFSPKRIAELINTTSNAVRVALHAKRKSKRA